MSEWTTPGLEQRGTCTPEVAEVMRDAEPWQLVAYIYLASGHPARWRYTRRKGYRLIVDKPLQILAPPKVNNVEGAKPEWVTVDETHNWSPRAS